jgi:seryl-tRNA synthetase
MLEINRIRQEKEAIIAGLAKRNLDVRSTVDQILELDLAWRNAKTDMEAISAELNQLAKTIGEFFKSGKQQEANDLKIKTTDVHPSQRTKRTSKTRKIG